MLPGMACARGIGLAAVLVWALGPGAASGQDVPRLPGERLAARAVTIRYTTGAAPLFVFQAEGIGLGESQSISLTVESSAPTQLRLYLIPKQGLARFRYVVLTRQRPVARLTLPLSTFDPDPQVARGEVPPGGALLAIDVPGFMRGRLENALRFGPCAAANVAAPMPPDQTPPGPSAEPDFDRALGAWLGKIAGGRLGMANEGKLEPAWDQLEVLARGLAPDTWGFGPDDDTTLMVSNLLLLAAKGSDFRAADVLDSWRGPALSGEYLWKTERRSLAEHARGVAAAECGRGPLGDSICARIRCDVWGLVSPGDAARARALAGRDAPCSNSGTGLQSGLFAATAAALAYRARSVRELLERALEHSGQPGSEHSRLLRQCLEWHKTKLPLREARERIRRECFEPIRMRDPANAWAYALPNDGLVALALLYGEGDFARTLALAAALGWDTDCNAATAGCWLGAMLGARRLPASFTAPLHDRLRVAIAGREHWSIARLAALTLELR